MSTAVRPFRGHAFRSPANIPGTETVAAEEQKAPATVTVLPRAVPDFSEPARFAKTLNARQFNVALDYLFRLDAFSSDLLLISEVRNAYPRDLASAEQITRWSLGNPQEFGARAMKNFMDSTCSAHVIKPTRFQKLLWPALLFLAFFIPAAGAFASGLTLLAMLAAGLCGAMVLRLFVVPPRIQGIPVIADTDWKMLHNDVVDSVLSSILERRGALTPEQAAALRRGFEHMRFISYTTAAMATAPYVAAAPVQAAA